MAMSEHELLAKMCENVGNALLENAKLLRAAPEAAAPAAGKRGKRKGRDGGAPKKKRSRTSYIIYVAEQFEAAKRAGGDDRPAKERMKEFGAKWAALSADAKAPYEARAAKEKQELAASQSAGALPAPGAASSGATSTPSGSQATVPATPHDGAKKKKKKDKKDKEERRKKKKEKQMAAA